MILKDDRIFYFTKHLAWQIEKNKGYIYILNKKNNEWYNINDVSMKIWLLVEKKMSVHEIVSNLSLEYDIEFQVLYKDIIDFLEEMLHEELIELYEQCN